MNFHTINSVNFSDIEFNIGREELHNYFPSAYRSYWKPTGGHGETSSCDKDKLKVFFINWSGGRGGGCDI